MQVAGQFGTIRGANRSASAFLQKIERVVDALAAHKVAGLSPGQRRKGPDIVCRLKRQRD